MREYLRNLPKAARMRLKLRALWCPLLLPGDKQGARKSGCAETARRSTKSSH
jgi:hypothetical protein